MQHAIMTLNNPSEVEIMAAENGNHIQVSCIALISCERIALDNLDVLHMHKRFEIIDKSFLCLLFAYANADTMQSCRNFDHYFI